MWRGRALGFPSTHWSAVSEAIAERSDGPRQALGKLLIRYLPALQAHLVLDKGLRPEQAEDLLQEFVLKKILQEGVLVCADRRKGKFRTFLLTVLDRYLIDQLRPKGLPVNYTEVEAVEDAPSPCEALNRAWACTVLAQAVERMRAECEASGRADIWGIFECRVLAPALDQADPVSYEQLVERFGFRSPLQAANVLTTAKRMLVRNLRAVVAEYTRDQDVDAEIGEIREILSGGA